ncbi:hypothetical protein MNEG_11652 [Monoraphidium neglectum]|uniref:Uncharacterized protein n=1 Tax=Monoraphidium neglectum TaxID=145388 RepID=A0A0D2MNN2_9CHLO|nr:hypothetical protein MNEG_11652 [Monoraphidium neglectum]KIY96310.1 hypothetical protein MNEG_11652 [Monoraphidium neglectum]|eukprot:XP_013895330.1 hypothetical protein MNEG_11652 [Monoraphidium neglectum]
MELDRASLLAVLQRLDKPGDLVTAALASPVIAHLARAPLLWTRFLSEHYGLHLEGPGLSSVDLQAVFARMAAARSTTKPSALRFLAAYTDGGTDGGEDELHYWAE